jgi:hypothetical protein
MILLRCSFLLEIDRQRRVEIFFFPIAIQGKDIRGGKLRRPGQLTIAWNKIFLVDLLVAIWIGYKTPPSCLYIE